jgi:dTDP-4-dehydrorhamnose reductase
LVQQFLRHLLQANLYPGNALSHLLGVEVVQVQATFRYHQRELVETEAAPGLYHCVNTGHASWATIADTIAKLLDVPLRIRPMTLASANLRARRPRYCALSNGKLRAAGVDMPDWQTALGEFLLHER